ncbi:hypothetical protein EUGRSUZ_B01584 [Eucalyptus grandis]|uniref:Uncharacterized protein n=2 Tax=Eucalyptus grandis TaxID=71139 RepID=A0ACC3LQU2_EUCGR|nr:hypothetical protein EUGRSUZ_B01584 [Eucalyptus grandis]
MTREPVTNSTGTAGSARRPYRRRGSGSGSSGRSVLVLGGATNPGAECAKELEQECDAPAAPYTVRARDAMQSHITHNDSRQRISRLSHR